jgi:hypothetical protein
MLKNTLVTPLKSLVRYSLEPLAFLFLLLLLFYASTALLHDLEKLRDRYSAVIAESRPDKNAPAVHALRSFSLPRTNPGGAELEALELCIDGTAYYLLVDGTGFSPVYVNGATKVCRNE